jgi:hypothetical protein
MTISPRSLDRCPHERRESEARIWSSLKARRSRRLTEAEAWLRPMENMCMAALFFPHTTIAIKFIIAHTEFRKFLLGNNKTD